MLEINKKNKSIFFADLFILDVVVITQIGTEVVYLGCFVILMKELF